MQPTSFVERWCALLASASQKWKLGWARRFFLLRGSIIFLKEAWNVFFYAFKNAAMDIKISCGIRVATGLVGCLILGKQNSRPLINLMESSLGFTSAIWNENCWFWLCINGSKFVQRKWTKTFSRARLCAPQRWAMGMDSHLQQWSLCEWLLPLNTSISFFWQPSFIPWNCHHQELVWWGPSFPNTSRQTVCTCRRSLSLISTLVAGQPCLLGCPTASLALCWKADPSFRTDTR